ILLQLFVLKKICPFCMAAHASGGMAAALLLFALSRSHAVLQSGGNRSPVVRSKLLAVAAFALAVLIGGQIVHQPPTYVVKPLPQASIVQSVSSTNREIQLFDGKFRLDLNGVPMLGSPQAPYVIVSLLDYTCYACRILH